MTHKMPPLGTPCEEALIENVLQRCGRAAVFYVQRRFGWSYSPPIPMCLACAQHNARNRGAIYVEEGS